MIAIVDYGMGNLRSVLNACLALGCEAELARGPEQLKDATRIILPGVGAFGDGMENLSAAGWIPALAEEVRGKGKPLLGICLGMQVLATAGTEHGNHHGLGWIDGVVDLMRPEDRRVRIPHIGWNDVHIVKADGLYAGLSGAPTFYFVHGYALLPKDPSLVSGLASHGVDFVASVEAPPIYGTQFHPEKSQRAGMQVLRNFASVRPC